MGINIYASWPGQTEADAKAQITGFSIAHGHVGYLREAYHGEPYATHVLVPEAFDHDRYPHGAPIAAAELRARLPEALRVAEERERVVYHHDRFHLHTRLTRQSFRNFVELCERKERETGEPCTISASY
jgi:hypothetical protein